MAIQWWEETWYAQAGEIKKKQMFPAHCPVCRSHLGNRIEGMVFSSRCMECKATFTFSPGADSPTVKMDEKERKVCTCSNCNKEEDKPEEELDDSYEHYQTHEE